jgi:hypothetical protein
MSKRARLDSNKRSMDEDERERGQGMTRHDGNKESTDGGSKGSGNAMCTKCRRQRRSNRVLHDTISVLFKPYSLGVSVICWSWGQRTSEGSVIMLRDDWIPKLPSF